MWKMHLIIPRKGYPMHFVLVSDYGTVLLRAETRLKKCETVP